MKSVYVYISKSCSMSKNIFEKLDAEVTVLDAFQDILNQISHKRCHMIIIGVALLDVLHKQKWVKDLEKRSFFENIPVFLIVERPGNDSSFDGLYTPEQRFRWLRTSWVKDILFVSPRMTQLEVSVLVYRVYRSLGVEKQYEGYSPAKIHIPSMEKGKVFLHSRLCWVEEESLSLCFESPAFFPENEEASLDIYLDGYLKRLNLTQIKKYDKQTYYGFGNVVSARMSQADWGAVSSHPYYLSHKPRPICRVLICILDMALARKVFDLVQSWKFEAIWPLTRKQWDDYLENLVCDFILVDEVVWDDFKSKGVYERLPEHRQIKFLGFFEEETAKNENIPSIVLVDGWEECLKPIFFSKIKSSQKQYFLAMEDLGPVVSVWDVYILNFSKNEIFISKSESLGAYKGILEIPNWHCRFWVQQETSHFTDKDLLYMDFGNQGAFKIMASISEYIIKQEFPELFIDKKTKYVYYGPAFLFKKEFWYFLSACLALGFIVFVVYLFQGSGVKTFSDSFRNVFEVLRGKNGE